MSSHYHTEEKLFIEASSTNNIKTEKKGFFPTAVVKGLSVVSFHTE